MKIAVTGSSGDVCTSVVAQALREGHQVLGLDVVEPGSESLERVHSAAEDAAERFEFRKIDMQKYDEVLAALLGCDALVHGAALATTVNIPNAVTHNTYNALRAGIEAGMTRITQLSSINCIGSLFTPYARQYHYLPLDEKHPYEPADPYALSKMICEVQADSLVRTFPSVRIASIRPHACLHKRPKNPLDDPNTVKYGREVDHFCTANINDLWGWTAMDAVARACLLGITSKGWTGSEAFYIVAPTTKIAEEGKPDRLTSAQLAEKYHPKAPLKPGYFEGEGQAGRGFYDTSKAERLLGWRHDL